MRKISASFFSERDFTAVELEIERLRSQAKEEKSRIEHAISRDHRMSQDKLNQPDIGNDNQKPQTVVAKLVKIDEKKPKSVEPELEPQFDDFLFPVAEEPSSTLEENRPSAPRFIKRTALNLERRPYTDDVSNRDGVHFATGAGWLSLKWSKLARRCSGWDDISRNRATVQRKKFGLGLRYRNRFDRRNRRFVSPEFDDCRSGCHAHYQS